MGYIPSEESPNKKIGARISYFRKYRNLTQEKLALYVGINSTYLSQIECGLVRSSISLPLLFKIAHALSVKPMDLINFDDLVAIDHVNAQNHNSSK